MKNVKMKVALLTTSDFPYHGAPESFVRQLALGLHENGVNIEVIRFWGDRYSCHNNLPIKCSNYLFRKPFKNDLIKFFETFLQILFIPFFMAYRRFFKMDQILLFYGLDRAYFVFPATIFCKIFCLKSFRIITEIYPNYLYASKWWRKPNILFNKWQIKYFDRYLSGVVVLSSKLQNLLVENKVRKEKIILIPHFIDLNTASSVSKTVNNSKSRIGFCGNPSIENGVIDLVQAFLLLLQASKQQLELIIIGKISPVIENAIYKIINGNKQIIFTGLLSKEEVVNELDKCDVLVSPRKSGVLAETGFPTKIGEYFAARKPVVATKVGDLQYYFTDKKELVFAEPNNTHSIFEALSFLINNKAKALEIAQNGYSWAENNLAYLNNTKKLIGFLETK